MHPPYVVLIVGTLPACCLYQTFSEHIFLKTVYFTIWILIQKQEGFLWCQTPTSSIRLKDEKWRIKVEWWKMKREWSRWGVKGEGKRNAVKTSFNIFLKYLFNIFLLLIKWGYTQNLIAPGQPLKILKDEYISNHLSDHNQILKFNYLDEQSLQILWMETTSKRRGPQNIKSVALQQPLDGSYSKFKHKLGWQNQSFQMPQMETNFYGRPC